MARLAVASSARYAFEDFNVPCKELATKLLGKYLVRKIGDSIIKGKIVETECYLGGEDKASYSFNGKVTDKNKPMFMPPGTCFVYLTYGMYHCFNISSGGEGAAVLLRAIEPVDCSDIVRENRRSFRPSKKITKTKELKEHELCNGPSKLCIGFHVDLTCNKMDLCTWADMWIEDNEDISEHFVITTSRIGIESVGKEWASAPLRFYVYDNPHVSKRDKKAEDIKFPKSPVSSQGETLENVRKKSKLK